MVLASQGIPATSTDGFAMIRDQQSMGTSQFIEQKRYQLAIEEELGNSISSIQAVQTARVHLAVPKQSVFVRNRVEPTASVILNPCPRAPIIRISSPGCGAYGGL